MVAAECSGPRKSWLRSPGKKPFIVSRTERRSISEAAPNSFLKNFGVPFGQSLQSGNHLPCLAGVIGALVPFAPALGKLGKLANDVEEVLI